MEQVERKNLALRASVSGIILNICLFAGKLTAGILSLSLAVIADALNNLSDASSSVITFIGFRISGKHADKDHPMGHGRLEYVAAFIVDMLIVFVGLELLKTSIEKIITPVAPETDIFTFILLGAAILVKLAMFFYYRSVGKRINSPALFAAAIDSLCDVAATSVVLVSALVWEFAGVNTDAYAGILVACFITFTGIRASKETIDLLLGRSPDRQFLESIRDFVKNYPDVVDIHDVMVHDYGPGRQIISFHAEVPSDMDFSYAHDVVDCIERDMHKKFNCIVTIHLDPIVVNDERVNSMHRLAEECAKSVDPAFTIHDFRITDGGKHVNMIFDLCIPPDCKLTKEAAAKAVADAIKAVDADCYAVIEAEYPFV